MRRLVAFALTLVLLVVVVTACGSGEDVTATPETVEGTVPAETGETGETETGETDTGETETGETETGETGEGEGQGDPQAGEEIFASAGCGGCHVLEEAGSSGTVGPNLDEADLSYDEAYQQIAEGGGGMPAFQDQLNEQELADVTAFVVESSGGG